MQDKQNLKKKLKKYPKELQKAIEDGDEGSARWWKSEIEDIKLRLSLAEKNRKKNKKLYKKAN